MSADDDYSLTVESINEHTGREPQEWCELDFAEIEGSPAFPDKRQVRQWALVLDSRNIPCLFDVRDNRWRLLVPVERYDAALGELVAYHHSNRDWPPPAVAARPLLENTLATVSVLILLATFHNITRMDIPGAPDWAAAGSARSDAILAGEWWRLVTALTLHADWGHLASNLVIGGIFTVFLCRDLGSGLSWGLAMSAGVLGNLVNASLHGAGHDSVGASTAVFGVVGILAAISLVRYRRQHQRRWPLPVASALALLALLGTEGKNTDLGAHLFGFVYGCCLGVVAEYLVERHGRPGALLNLLLGVICAATVAGSWWVATLP